MSTAAAAYKATLIRFGAGPNLEGANIGGVRQFSLEIPDSARIVDSARTVDSTCQL